VLGSGLLAAGRNVFASGQNFVILGQHCVRIWVALGREGERLHFGKNFEVKIWLG
jgi:hypothetical protein